MKRVLIVVAALLALSTMVTAQSQVKPVFFAGGGMGMPLAPSFFSDYWKMGYGFGGGAGVQINPSIEITGKVFYNTFTFDGDKFLKEFSLGEDVSGITIDGLDFKAIEFGVDFKYILLANQPEAKFRPFMVVGAGMANIKFDDVTITGDSESVMLPTGAFSETDFAIGGGAGFDYMFAPKTGVWLEARVNVIMTEGESTTYLPIRAGVKFLFGQ